MSCYDRFVNYRISFLTSLTNKLVLFCSGKPLADAEGAKKLPIIELLTLNGGLSYVSIFNGRSIILKQRK